MSAARWIAQAPFNPATPGASTVQFRLTRAISLSSATAGAVTPTMQGLLKLERQR